MTQGSEFDSPLQTAHLLECFLKGVLSVKMSIVRVRPGAFAVLLVPCCCQVFQLSALAGVVACMKIVLHADIALGASYRKCWTAEFIEACVGLRAADTYTNCIEAATPLPLQDFLVDCVSACVQYGGS